MHSLRIERNKMCRRRGHVSPDAHQHKRTATVLRGRERETARASSSLLSLFGEEDGNNNSHSKHKCSQTLPVSLFSVIRVARIGYCRSNTSTIRIGVGSAHHLYTYSYTPFMVSHSSTPNKMKCRESRMISNTDIRCVTTIHWLCGLLRCART